MQRGYVVCLKQYSAEIFDCYFIPEASWKAEWHELLENSHPHDGNWSLAEFCKNLGILHDELEEGNFELPRESFVVIKAYQYQFG